MCFANVNPKLLSVEQACTISCSVLPTLYSRSCLQSYCDQSSVVAGSRPASSSISKTCHWWTQAHSLTRSFQVIFKEAGAFAALQQLAAELWPQAWYSQNLHSGQAHLRTDP